MSNMASSALNPTPQARKGFFDLPPELRVRIYETIFDPVSPKQRLLEIDLPPPFWKNNDITEVCQQMRKESLPIFYRLNRFSFTLQDYAYPLGLMNFSSFLRFSGEKKGGYEIKPELEHVRSIELKMRTEANGVALLPLNGDKTWTLSWVIISLSLHPHKLNVRVSFDATLWASGRLKGLVPEWNSLKSHLEWVFYNSLLATKSEWNGHLLVRAVEFLMLSEDAIPAIFMPIRDRDVSVFAEWPKTLDGCAALKKIAIGPITPSGWASEKKEDHLGLVIARLAKGGRSRTE